MNTKHFRYLKRRKPEAIWPSAGGGDYAFTLVELLVVIAIIAILAVLLMPVLPSAKVKTQAASCLSNFKNLQVAWHLYTVDNRDALPANKWQQVDWQFDCPSGVQCSSDSWVLGDATTDVSTWNIQHGSLYYYMSGAEPYHCPSDRSMVLGAPTVRRTRSYSMSYYMNGSEHKPERKTKLCQINAPARVFVFLDEQETSINDGVFYIHVPGDAGEQVEGPHWMDLPADRHKLGCNISDVDGHAERVKWLWPKNWDAPNSPHPANDQDLRDMRRLQEGIPAP